MDEILPISRKKMDEIANEVLNRNQSFRKHRIAFIEEIEEYKDSKQRQGRW